jgi:hypothetical protein
MACSSPQQLERRNGGYRGWRLLDLGQDLFLIADDRIQSALVLQNGCLVLLDRFLIRFDGALVRENRLLVLQNPLLVCDYVILGHFRIFLVFGFVSFVRPVGPIRPVIK